MTPYTTEHHGMIERWFRSLKEECVWQLSFRTFNEARHAISTWIRWGNEECPHQALGYCNPRQDHVRPLLAA
jgi:putative transposase